MVKRISAFYNDLNLTYKIFLTYLILICIPFILFIYFNNLYVKKDLEASFQQTFRQSFVQGRSYIEYKVSGVESYMRVVANNEIVREMLKKPASYYKDRASFWNFDITEIRRQFSNSNPTGDTADTKLYTDSGLTAYYQTDDFITFAGLSKSLSKAVFDKSETYIWFQPPKDKEDPVSYVSAVRRITDVDNFNNTLAILQVDINEDILTAILSNMTSIKNSHVYLLDKDNRIMLNTAPENMTVKNYISNLIATGSEDELSNGFWGEKSLGNEKYLICIQSVDRTPFYLAAAISYDQIMSAQSKTYRRMLVMILIFSVSVFPLAYLGASSSTRRIRQLILHMKDVQVGNFNISILSGSKDEIGVLSMNFNAMVTKVSMLLDEKYQLGHEIKSMELRALQAQINPHFLYNTLDLIYWRSIEQNDKGITDLILALSRFYKLSLSKGNDIVSLKNELEHVKAYVQIQNVRYKNIITLGIYVPDNLLSYTIPKITLQPLVENAIVHGILEKKQFQGTIEIFAVQNEHEMTIEIRDDGIGMTQEDIDKLFFPLTDDSLHGFGIYNINKRIKLIFGDKYGLSFESIKGSGTTAILHLPL